VSALPYILFASVILLANPFKQSQIAMVSITLLIAYWVIQNRLQTPLSSGTTILELSLLASLVPFVLFIVNYFKNSSLFSLPFLLFLVTLSLAMGWAYLILVHFYEGGFDNINDTFLFVRPEISRLPLIIVIFNAAMVLIFSIFVMSRNKIIDVVLYSSTLLASVTFVFFHVTYVSSTMFSLAGILLLIYVFSASYELAFTDRLTEIPGRLALESDLKHLGRSYTIAMLDIDHFKSFNDTYGHDTGDEVLRLVASKMRSVGGRARIYRYGGEEFTILFKGKTAEEAHEHVESLRMSIESYEMVLRNQDARPKSDQEGTKKRKSIAGDQSSVSVTISIGVADSSSGTKVSHVMKAADNALYDAKKKGRNRVCLV
jgi:GGDEF domain-containing protein